MTCHTCRTGRMRVAVAALALCFGGCRSTQSVVEDAPPPPPPPVTHWAGVDSTVARAANALADLALVPLARQAEGRAAAQHALDLAHIADSLLGPAGVFSLARGEDTVSVETRNTAIEAFNEGAAALGASGASTDSLKAAALLTEAATAFQLALEANPFDEEAHYWLSRVYEVQANALGQAGAVEDAIATLRRLVSMHHQRHDYLALLAEAHERRATGDGSLAAGTLWERAAQAAMDDASLGGALLDSAAVFTYLGRSSRAFIGAHEGALALQALDSAAPFARSGEDFDYLRAERAWITWDDGVLHTRMRFDSLLALAATQPEAAVDGLRLLVGDVTTRRAHVEVRHDLALLLYQIGRVDDGLRLIASLWEAVQGGDGVSTDRVSRVREDYGVMAFNIGVAKEEAGELRAALGYLLQSEATGFGQAARAAFEVSRLLRNDAAASLAAALRAEGAIGQLAVEERDALLRHIVELYRRLGDRESAQGYVRKIRMPQ